MFVLILELDQRAGDQPNFFNFEMLSFFLGVPSGLDLSKTMSPLKPTMSLIKDANSLIVTSLLVPILIGS